MTARPEQHVAGNDIDPGRRLVLVLVGSLDRRATDPLLHAWRIPARERRALHVAVGQADLWRLWDAWQEASESMPLFVVENAGGVAATVARVVRCELATFDQVVVVAGRTSASGLGCSLFRDRTADAISRELGEIPGVLQAFMSVPVG